MTHHHRAYDPFFNKELIVTFVRFAYSCTMFRTNLHKIARPNHFICQRGTWKWLCLHILVFFSLQVAKCQQYTQSSGLCDADFGASRNLLESREPPAWLCGTKDDSIPYRFSCIPHGTRVAAGNSKREALVVREPP